MSFHRGGNITVVWSVDMPQPKSRIETVLRRRLCGNRLLCLSYSGDQVKEVEVGHPEDQYFRSTATEYLELLKTIDYPSFTLKKTQMLTGYNWLYAAIAQNEEMPHCRVGIIPVLFARFCERQCQFISVLVDNYSGEISAVIEHGNLEQCDESSKKILSHCIVVSNRRIPNRVSFSLSQFVSFAARTLPRVPEVTGLLEELRFQRANASSFSEMCMNIGDTEVANDLELCVRSSTLPLLFALSRISGLSCDQICDMSPSIFTVNCMKSLFARNGFYAQPLTGSLKEHDPQTSVKGGKVLPMIQTDRPVIALDFFMLYPSIVVETNVGVGTTFVVPSKETCLRQIASRVRVWKRSPFSTVIAAKTPEGPFSASLRFLINLRRNAQSEGEKNAIKIIANTSIGLLSTEAGKFLGGKVVADIITLEGRKVLSRLVAAAESRGLRVIYGDTDSIFVQNDAMIQVSEIVDSLCVEATQSAGFKLRVENNFKRLYANRKKLYVGFGYLANANDVVIKGVQHSMSPTFLRSYAELLCNLRDNSGFQTFALKTFDPAQWSSYNQHKEEYVCLSDDSIVLVDDYIREKTARQQRMSPNRARQTDATFRTAEIACFPDIPLCVSADYLFSGPRGDIALSVSKKNDIKDIVRLVQNEQVDAFFCSNHKHLYLSTCTCIDVCIDLKNVSTKLRNILETVARKWKCHDDCKTQTSLRLQQDNEDIFFDPPLPAVKSALCFIISPDMDDLQKFVCALPRISSLVTAENKKVLYDALTSSCSTAIHTSVGTFAFDNRSFTGFVDIRYKHL